MNKKLNDNICYNCSKIITKDEAGLSKKLLGKSTNKLYCLHCLALEFEVTEEDLLGKIEEFKNEGCTLFK